MGSAALAQGGGCDFTCEDVSTTMEGFFTVLEEPLISVDDECKSHPKNTRLCFRVCEMEPSEGESMIVRHCEYKKLDASECDASNTGVYACQRVQIIRSQSGADLIYSYVGMIYKWAASIIGIVSVLTIVYSGIGIMASAGDSGNLDKHKQRITQSIVGLVILFLSGLILYTINPTFFV